MDFKMAEKKKKAKFVRTDFRKYSKLGVRRKKKQVYRKAKGIDNKIRLNMKGHTTKVKIGYRSAKKQRDLLKGLEKVTVRNVEDLKSIKEGQIGVVARVGAKKKQEIAKSALEKDIKLFNLNPKKFLGVVEETLKERKEKKEERKKKKVSKEKKEKEKAEKEEKKAKEKKDEKEEKKETVEKKVEEKVTPKTEEKKSDTNKKEIQTNNYGRGK